MSNQGFQVQAYNQPALGVAGQVDTSNPYAVVNAGPGGLVAGAAGVVVGRFAWIYPPDDPNGGYQQVQNTSLASGGLPTTTPFFVPWNLQAQNSTFLSNAGMTILQGYQMYLLSQGDVLAVNDGTVVPVPYYSKAFADVATGKVKFGNPGSTFGGATASSWSIANATASVTASISDDIMTVTVLGSGNVYPGAVLSGTGVATATAVVSQVTPLLAGEAANGVGRYLVSIGQQTVASTTITATYGLLTLTTVATGTFAVGDILTGTSVTAGSQITQFITGSGGSGSTAAVNYTSTASSGTLTASTAVETAWVATSTGPNGAIIKLSTWQPRTST